MIVEIPDFPALEIPQDVADVFPYSIEMTMSMSFGDFVYNVGIVICSDSPAVSDDAYNLVFPGESVCFMCDPDLLEWAEMTVEDLGEVTLAGGDGYSVTIHQCNYDVMQGDVDADGNVIATDRICLPMVTDFDNASLSLPYSFFKKIADTVRSICNINDEMTSYTLLENIKTIENIDSIGDTGKFAATLSDVNLLSVLEGACENLDDDRIAEIRARAFEVYKEDGTATANPIHTVLKTIRLANTKSIGAEAFKCNVYLERVDLHTIENIGAAAFGYCSQLATFIIRNTIGVVQFLGDPFFNTPIKTGGGYIYVPASMADAYKADANWSIYASQIRAIEDYPDICGG